MKTIIGLHEISDNQTKVFYTNDWYDIIEDMDGECYFMVGNEAVYFEIAEAKN